MNTRKTINSYENKQRKLVVQIKTYKWIRYLFVLIGVVAGVFSVLALVFAIIYRYNESIADERIATPFTLTFAIALAVFVLGLLLFCGCNAAIEEKEKEIHSIDEQITEWSNRKPSISEPKKR